MAEVTQDMILDYLIRKGGLVKNVDLVRHFRKYLQIENSIMKDRARVIFKERVNAVAFIRAEKHEKYLHLRPEFIPPGGLTRPPSGRPPTGSDHCSISSLEDLGGAARRPSPLGDLVDQHPPLDNRFSAISDTPSVKSSELGILESDLLTKSHTVTASPPSTIQSPAPSPLMQAPPPSDSPTMSGKLKSIGEDDFGSSLMAELSSFGTLFDSFGTSGQSSHPAKVPLSSSSVPSSTNPGVGVEQYPSRVSSSANTSSLAMASPSSLATVTNSIPSSNSTVSTISGVSPPRQSANYFHQRNPEGHLANNFSPSHYSNPPGQSNGPSKKPGGRGQSSNMDLDLTSVLTSLPSANSKKQSGRRQSADLDLDLTSVLSSLPSANLSNFEKKKKPVEGRGKASNITGESSRQHQSSSIQPLPSQQTQPVVSKPAYQNSTRFDQPAYQNSTRFDQPKVYQNSTRFDQPAYQNSTRFDQPAYQNSTRFDQPAYQNTTRFDQPKVYQNSTRFDQPAYQNSTRFDQPAYQNSTRFDQPAYQNSTRFDQPAYQNSTRFDQPATARVDQPNITQPSYNQTIQPTTVSNSRNSLENYPMSPPVSSEPKTSPSGGRKPPPPAPVRTSSISKGIISTDSLPRNSTGSPKSIPRRPAPAPPSSEQKGVDATAPTDSARSSTHQQSSPSSYSSLGCINLGDFGSSMFSTIGGSTLATPSPPTQTGQVVNDSSPVHHSSRVSSDARLATPPNSKLDSLVSTSPSGPNGMRGIRMDRRNSDSSHRQASLDNAPSIRIDSPSNVSTNGSGSPSHNGRGRSPPYVSGRVGSGSSGSLSSIGPGVQLRNKEGKSGRSANSAVRRSKNIDKNSNLDNFTRLSISMTPPAVRKHRPPDVAPKPFKSSSLSRSHDNILGQQGYMEGDEDAGSEYDYEDIDPLEKEWMLEAAQAHIDGLQRLLMTDITLLNRRGFLHGYTALHWAAKHGRMDILSMLLIQGAQAGIKSNGGLTPLHLAAEAGHDNVIEVLVTQHNANISLRENGGRRPLDMLNIKASQRSRTLLSNLTNHGLPVRAECKQFLSTFSQRRDSRSSLDRNWSSLGELMHNTIDKDKFVSKKRLSPRSTIRKSFSFRNRHKINQTKEQQQFTSPKREKKKKSSSPRPHSDIYDV